MTNKQIGVNLEFIFTGKIINLAPPNQPGDAVIKQYVDDAIDGVSGINAFTTTTASFLVPAVNYNVTVAVAESRWMVVGQVLFTEFGSFRVQAINSNTAIGLFQSLVGFKINWNSLSVLGRSHPRTFQSLVGFKINWNNVGASG